MSLKFKFLLFFALMPGIVKAQVNLVENPLFNLYSNCPDSLGQFNQSDGYLEGWESIHTADFFHSCNNTENGGNNEVGVPENNAGFQDPHLSKGYAGIISAWKETSSTIETYREYIVTQVDLVAGKKYTVQFYASLASKSGYMTNGMGAQISPTPPTLQSGSGILSGAATFINDTVLDQPGEWKKNSFDYTATQTGLHYLILGNFYANSEVTIKINPNSDPNPGDFAFLAYYYIDDLLVTETPEPCKITGGTNGSSTSLYKWIFVGNANGLSQGMYFVQRHEITRQISFPYSEDPEIIVDSSQTLGWSQANPNNGNGWFEVVPGTLTHTSATLRTYVYYVASDAQGKQIKKYYPTAPSSVVFAYNKPELEILVQNKTFNFFDRLLAKFRILAGRQVDPDHSLGNVIIASGANVTFKAGDSIYLEPGFNAEEKSEFLALISTNFCDP